MIPFGTNVRTRQDITFPRQTVFPHDPSYMAGNRRLMRRPGPGRPFGVPGARVNEPELGDIGDAIGGGTEVFGPDQEPGFPGGATPRASFIPPAPFPEAPPGPEPPSDFDRALRLGGLTLGGAKQVASLVNAARAPEAPGTGFQRNEAAFQAQRAGERLDLGDLADVVGGADVNLPEFDLAGDLGDLGDVSPEFDLGDLDTSFNPVLGGATQVPEFDIAADLETSFGDTSTGTDGAGVGGIGLGDIAGGIAAGVGITGAILSDRPIEQKAAISAVSAGQVAAPAIAGAVGGAAAASTASTVAGGVGLALSLAMLGETLSKGDDPDATEAQRIAADREKAKAVANATASLISLGGALLAGGATGGAIGAVISLGLTIDSIARYFDAQEQDPPVGGNWNDYKSILTGYTLEDQLPETFSRATNPLQLLGFALAGPALAPNGEVQIAHSTWGSGGDFDTPVSPQLAENLSKIAATGDPDLLREYIRGVSIRTGSSGTTQDNWLMTDTYRRTLVSLLPASHPVRQEAEAGTSDLFGSTPDNYSATGGIEQWLSVERQSAAAQWAGEPDPVRASENAKMIVRLQAGETPRWQPPLRYGVEGQAPYRNWPPSSLFRQPGELELTAEQREHYIGVLMSTLPPAPGFSEPFYDMETGGFRTMRDESRQGDPLTYWLNYIPQQDLGGDSGD